MSWRRGGRPLIDGVSHASSCLLPSDLPIAQNHVHSSVVTTLLAEMDGLASRGNVFVIAATNRIGTSPPRPTRFNQILTENPLGAQTASIRPSAAPAASTANSSSLPPTA